MSARLIRSDDGFAFGFRCDSCDRPEIIALLIPAAWEALRDANGVLRHQCGGCRFDAIARELGWRRAA